MSEFTFSLGGGTAGLIGQVPKAQAGFESNLAAGVKDSDLTYRGDDYLVWDRVNGERLRRGLPGLAAIGSPRPKDSPPPADSASAYYGPPPNINIPELTGEVFKISGPPGMTFDQARAIFDSQVKTGSLTGFKVGDTLSAATQAADGLEAAKAELSQTVAGLGGNLPAGTNLNSLTAALGPGGAAAAGQIGAAMTGSSAALSGFVTSATGLPGTVGGALSGITTSIQGLRPGLEGASTGLLSSLNTTAAGGSSTAVLGALTGAAARLGTVANQAIGTITRTLEGTPTNGINVADFIKQGPVLGGIGNMTSADVTSALAQANKLVGQTARDISNNLGVGKFGFDIPQLERAGVVKPGTAANWLESGDPDITGVLQSPTVWTGRDGIRNLGSFLGNSPLQDKLQQDLMKSGLNDLQAQGVPTNNLTAQAQAGISSMAAKSVSATMSWIKNNGDIPPEVKAGFDNIAVNSAFAVNLAKTRVDAPVKQQVVPVPASNTVQASTVTAASDRLVGNNKVPEVLAGNSSTSKFLAIYQWKNFVEQNVIAFRALNAELYTAQSRGITTEQYDQYKGQASALRAIIRQRAQPLLDAATQEAQSISSSGATVSEQLALKEFELANFLENNELLRESDRARDLLRDLSYRIRQY